MKKAIFYLTAASLLLFTMTSCGDDDSVITSSSIDLNLSGLDNLGDGFAYEGWLIVNGAAVTTGVFTVNDAGVASQTSFDVEKSDWDNASTFVLTIEPSPDSDPGPTDVHILAGDINANGGATLTVGHGAALANDFTASTGKYILATPTDGENNNENSGVWWLDTATGPGPGLDLPTLPAGWAYEGWAVIDGTPVSTGTFTSVMGSDSDARFSGDAAGPPFPGEDFLRNAPTGLDFPVDLSGNTVVISVEPVPDNSPAPFTLKPLVGPVAAGAVDHTVYAMNNNAAASNPTGSIISVSR